MNVTVRRLRADDLPEIAVVQQASPEAAQWAPQDYLSYDCLVAICNGAIAGFLVTRTLATGEHEILNLAVAPEWRRQGVARRLVSDVNVLLRGAVYLEVRASNQIAQNFYKSIGFQEVARRQNYYAEPLEAAIVMKFHSC
jgi:ribosomal-protein-alanine N-acetyltransferase